MIPQSSRRLLARFTSVAGAQGMVAAFNLALQLALVRGMMPEAYGQFVLLQTVVLVAFSVQEALVALPLGVRVPYTPHNPRRFVLERRVASFALVLGAAAATATGLFAAAAPGGSLPLAIAVAGYTLAFLLYSAVRALALSRSAVRISLAVDGAYAGLSLLALAALLAADGLTLPLLFATLALGPAGAAALGLARLGRPPVPGLRRALAGYRGIWRDSRWTLVAVVAQEMQDRVFVFALTAAHGPEAVAAVAAGALVVRPVAVVIIALPAFARPVLAQARAAGEHRRVVRLAFLAAAGGVGLYAANLVALGFVWPLVETHVYPRYPDQWTTVVLWSAVQAAKAVVMVLAMLLVVYGRYRDDSTIALAGAATVLAGLGLTTAVLPPPGALLALGAGALVVGALAFARLRPVLRAAG